MAQSPMAVECTTIEMPTEGHTRGLVNRLRQWGYEVEYDEESDSYKVGEFDWDNAPFPE